ncbi:MAG: hypothetical protein WCK46_01930 [Candidatus Adlerbacteria bacterium]
MKKNILVALSLLGFSVALAPVLASAATAVTTSANITTPVATVTMSASAMAAAKARGDKELDRRIAALTDVNARIQTMQKVTDAFKQNLATNIQTQITGFAALKSKIQADTDAGVLKADVTSITQSYRVYALILPQVRIAAAADRGVLIAEMMTTLGNKLAARIQAAGKGGADVTALTASLNDLGAKISDASTQAQASVSTSAALTPDGGDKTKMASNTATLAKARANLAAAEKDFQAARKDIDSIIKGLKVAASATTNTTVSH